MSTQNNEQAAIDPMEQEKRMMIAAQDQLGRIEIAIPYLMQRAYAAQKYFKLASGQDKAKQSYAEAVNACNIKIKEILGL